MYAWHNWTNIYTLDYDTAGDPVLISAGIYDQSTGGIVPGSAAWFSADALTISDTVIITIT